MYEKDGVVMIPLDLMTDIVINGNKYLVSTIDIPLFGEVFYETCVFEYNGDEVDTLRDLYNERYDSREEAIVGHKEVLTKLRNGEIVV